MKKTLRKAVAVLLSVIMIVCSVPFTALAEVDSLGWWGTNDWSTSTNKELRELCKERADGTYYFDDYDGWNSANFVDAGFVQGNYFMPETDYGMGADALDLVENVYKPTMTVSVWDQGDADNRIWNKYYGYGTNAASALSYDDCAQYKMNPAKLTAGDRIAVTVELGGFDALYSAQVKGIADPEYLSYAYYSMNPTSKDRWTIAAEGSSKAALNRGYSFYGTSCDDGNGPEYHVGTGQLLCPFSCKATPENSNYILKPSDGRAFGEHGYYVATWSFEVLKDCDLSEVLHFNTDEIKSEARLTTYVLPYSAAEVGKTAMYTFQTTAESVHETSVLMAVNWDGYEEATEPTPVACTHAKAEHHDAVPATCKDTGMIEYWYCPDCLKYFSDAEFKTEITVDDTTDGRVTDKNPTNHTSVSKVEGSAATCSSTGKKDSYVCAGCGNVYTEATAIYADDGETITGWTVDEDSKVANEDALVLDIVATAHKWGAWTEAGTDAETGNYIHTRTCELNANHTETADCTFGELITDTPATEKTKGAGHYVCTECGQVKSVVLDELPCDHAAATEVTKVDAKCDSTGREAYWTCPTCGKNFTDSTCTVQVTDLTTLDIPAIEHKNAQPVVATPATCTSTGIVAHYHCPDCGLDFTDATCTTELADTTAPIVDTAHSWGDWTPAGKNAEDTYIHTRTCNYNTAHIETANCTFGELQVVEAATETKEGKGYYECTVCGQIYDYVIPVKDCAHASMETHPRVEATCAKEGNIAYWYCPTCDKYFSDAEGNVEITKPDTVLAVVADAHSWSDWSSNNDGTHSRTCANEGCPVGTQTADCTMELKTAEVPADCETDGTTAVYECPDCNYQTGGTTITKTGHAWGAWTSNNDGTHSRTCSNANCPVGTQNADCTMELKTAEVPADCETDGTTAVYVCPDCSYQTGGTTITKTGHAWSAWTEVDGTDTHTRTCSNANCPIGTETEPHAWVETAAEVPATFDAAGTTAAYECSACGATKGGEPIAQLESWTIAVEASEYGTSTLNDKDSSAGLSMKVGKDTTVTLTATAVEGCQFIGWKLDNKIVSDQATYSFTAIANATYTPVYTESINNTFTVVFADAYGNIIATINAVDSADLVAQAEAITVPVMPGKTFTGWSEDLSTISAGMTVYAQYSTDASALYTVTATGCTITDENGNTADDVMENVPYNTKVTVAAKNGTASYWTINDATGRTLSYDAEYSFYVGANITVVPVITEDVVVATPTVTAVKTSSTTDESGYTRAVFLASRTMTSGYTYVSSGIIYGVNGNVTADTTLNDVDGKTVRRFETSTSSEQFSLTVGIKVQTGTVSAVAYLTYKGADGKPVTTYAPFADFVY